MNLLFIEGPVRQFFPQQTTVPTIPTAYETVLQRQPREKEGFDSSAPRFATSSWSTGVDPEITSIGPHVGMQAFFDDKVSFSKRGYGSGFASKVHMIVWIEVFVDISIERFFSLEQPFSG